MGMKANSKNFKGTKGEINYSKEKSPQNGIDYNKSNSKSVNNVEIVKNVNGNIKLTGNPNSVYIKHNKNGDIKTERYFGKNGEAYLDIDYTNHGNPKTHPVVPHEHIIYKYKGKLIRSRKYRRIKK